MMMEGELFESFVIVLRCVMKVLATHVSGARHCTLDPARLEHIRERFRVHAPAMSSPLGVAQWAAWFILKNNPISGADPDRKGVDINAIAATACVIALLRPGLKGVNALADLAAARWSEEISALYNAGDPERIMRVVAGIEARLDRMP